MSSESENISQSFFYIPEEEQLMELHGMVSKKVNMTKSTSKFH